MAHLNHLILKQENLLINIAKLLVDDINQLNYLIWIKVEYLLI